MISKEEIRQKVKLLVQKYDNLVKRGEIKFYNEERTKAEFIEPLFEALGWDVRNIETYDEVTREEKISKGRVDYGFRLNNIPKFFLEAKALNKQELLLQQNIKQATDYSWHKSNTWAVLTDFRQIALFNAETKDVDNRLFLIKAENYIGGDFDQLLLLTKESFEKGEIDKLAEKWDKKKRRTPIDKQLLSDFTIFRELLSKNISKNNIIDEATLDECVQKILDRLIFIRVCEDREIESPILQSRTREWLSNWHKMKLTLSDIMAEIFRTFDDKYNSELFRYHECEKLKIDGNILSKIIEGLYFSQEGHSIYDFSAIEADTLGNIYEQYLGHLLNKTKKGASVKEVKTHRKEQGIYYTPTYIVDYIVKNTVAEYAKGKTLDEILDMKILDPACGSGSFLIRAFSETTKIVEDHMKNGEVSKKALSFKSYSGRLSLAQKIYIIKNCIFGVDLDKQAVEIARLNLLMKLLEGESTKTLSNIKEMKKLLPMLDNIKCGNSLIDDEKIAGDKAFKWEEEFEDIIKEGGFDVVIGNPPYVRVDSLSEKDKTYWKKKFVSAQGKYDLYYLFVEKVFDLLKDGIFSFIIPNKFCAASSAKVLRNLLVTKSNYCSIISVSRLDVFKDASNYPIILIIKKGKNLKKVNIGYVNSDMDFLSRNFTTYAINEENFEVMPDKIFPINIDQNQFDLMIRLISINEKLSKHLEISEGLRIPPSLEETTKKDFSILKQYQFEKWGFIRKGSYISEENLSKVISSTSKRYKNFMKDKIVIAEDALTISATLDTNKMIPQGGVYFAVSINKKTYLLYILSLLNSKLLSFIYKTLFGGMHMGGGYLRYRTEFLGHLPIKPVSESQQQTLTKLADKILSLSKRNNEIGDKKIDEKVKIKEDINRIDNEINEIIYKIYGIANNEIKLIESVK